MELIAILNRRPVMMRFPYSPRGEKAVWRGRGPWNELVSSIEGHSTRDHNIGVPGEQKQELQDGAFWITMGENKAQECKPLIAAKVENTVLIMFVTLQEWWL